MTCYINISSLHLRLPSARCSALTILPRSTGGTMRFPDLISSSASLANLRRETQTSLRSQSGFSHRVRFHAVSPRWSKSRRVTTRGLNHLYCLPFIKQQISLPQALTGRYSDDEFLGDSLDMPANRRVLEGMATRTTQSPKRLAESKDARHT